MNQTPVSLNDLPRFSEWPARLLGTSPWELRHKTPAALAREYGVEKWGRLLERAEHTKEKVSVADVIRWEFEASTPGLSTIGSDWVLEHPRTIHHRYVSKLRR
ncbi:MAG: hypothetical protein M9963_09230 [Kiritimatiellae bacterium]|nr:hypothetical protein [Kiritimatiellia bacterium]MCO6399664.1 hypothetical protein [Verrucomicrobiota bacterium]